MKDVITSNGVTSPRPSTDGEYKKITPWICLGLFAGYLLLIAIMNVAGCLNTWMLTVVPAALLTVLAAFHRLLPAELCKWGNIILKTLPRDIMGAIALLKLRWRIHAGLRNNVTVPNAFQGNVRRYPNKACIVSEERTWTFREVDEASNRVANIFYEAGYRRGDIMALFMENCPEFAIIWLGLAKIGVITAFINFNLRQQLLLHSFNVANVKGVIFGADFADAISEIRDSFQEDMDLYCSGSCKDIPFLVKSLDSLLDSSSSKSPPKVDAKFTDRLIYIYTSGTTGLPKPAIITHLRYTYMASSVRYAFGIRCDDVLYDPLPLYHSAGCGLGLGQSLLYGTTVVIKKKFSASRFWDDCIKHKCTVSQYIGEMCRYLLALPEKPQDKMHSVRLMYGNGLRPQSWQKFVDRFGIKQLGEFYGSTEGNASLANINNRVGAVGFFSRFAQHRIYPCTLIKLDDDGVPVRNADGRCVLCGPDEPGELVGRISARDPIRKFDGYVDKASTEQKLISNVFAMGDTCFKTGDIMVMDELGYVYFVDRSGDTFRWKGENVSTAEVEGVICNIVALRDTIVYGVEVPGAEGRAGMATIMDKDRTLDLDDFARSLEKALPLYARPVFIRLMDDVPVTDTFKLKKVDLQKEGFDPSLCADSRLFYYDGKKYAVLDEAVHAAIYNEQLIRV